MIGSLSGILLEKNPPYLMVDVNGVGYELEAPLSTHFKLPNVGQSVTLYTHTHIREDAHTLYGFQNEKEKALFRMLIKVSGVGPKLALAILSNMEVDSFIRSIQLRDEAALLRVSGLGKKSVERLFLELSSKLKEKKEHRAMALGSSISNQNQDILNQNKDIPNQNQNQNQNQDISIQSRASLEETAFSALLALGYKREEASRAILKSLQELSIGTAPSGTAHSGTSPADTLSPEILLRKALQQLVNA